MKRHNIFITLFFSAIVFPFFGIASNAEALGSYGCGNPDKITHVNCLRGLLASTPYGITVKQSSPSKDGLGNYGCGNSNKRKHTNCLRRLLDEHGAHYQVGNHGGGAQGTHPPVDISHCADLPPTTRPQCEADAHGGPGTHLTAATGMASGTHPPGDMSHCGTLPQELQSQCEADAHGGTGTHPPGDMSHCGTLPQELQSQCEAAVHGGP